MDSFTFMDVYMGPICVHRTWHPAVLSNLCNFHEVYYACMPFLPFPISYCLPLVCMTSLPLPISFYPIVLPRLSSALRSRYRFGSKPTFPSFASPLSFPWWSPTLIKAYPGLLSSILDMLFLLSSLLAL